MVSWIYYRNKLQYVTISLLENSIMVNPKLVYCYTVPLSEFQTVNYK